MIVDGGMKIDAHWSRRLMALAENNETLDKNCTEPGRKGHFIISIITVLANVDTRSWRSEALYWVSALLVFPSFCGIKITPLTSQSLLKSAS